MSYPRRFFLLIGIFASVIIFAVTSTQAQTPELTYGTSTLGKLDSGMPFSFFRFQGQRLVSFDAMFQPTLSLVAPTGQQLAFGWQDVTSPGNHARVDILLPQDGLYNVQVGTQDGGDGQFMLRLDGLNINQAHPALTEETFMVDFASGSPQQMLRVEGSLSDVQVLQFEGSGGQFFASVHGANGTLLGIVTSNPQGLAYFALPPNDATYTVFITNADVQPQTVLLSIGQGESTQFIQTTPSSTIASNTGACTVITGNGGTNLRTGPGTNYTVLTTLPGQTQYTVTGQNTGWYAIQHQNSTGWLFGGVTSLTGACNSVSVINAPAPPSTISSGSTDAGGNSGGNTGGGDSGNGGANPSDNVLGNVSGNATAVPPTPVIATQVPVIIQPTNPPPPTLAPPTNPPPVTRVPVEPPIGGGCEDQTVICFEQAH
jgi:hypothetical protein